MEVSLAEASLRVILGLFYNCVPVVCLWQGRLANIGPPDAEGWSREASKSFLAMVNNNRILYAMILERSPVSADLQPSHSVDGAGQPRDTGLVPEGSGGGALDVTPAGCVAFWYSY